MTGEGETGVEGGGFEDARERMVDRLVERGYARCESTQGALLAVPRQAFVPENRRDRAYADQPLPIADGQTISAPHMVAEMLDLLDLRTGERVLEIGTGCGYHAAVTAEVVGPENVFSVEYGETLARAARERLAGIWFSGISVRAGDGREGWPKKAPFDAAYLTCAASSFPDAVVEQVRPEGRLLAPIESNQRLLPSSQTLVLAEKRADGTLDREEKGGVRFVPMRE